MITRRNGLVKSISKNELHWKSYFRFVQKLAEKSWYQGNMEKLFHGYLYNNEKANYPKSLNFDKSP